MFLKTDKYLLYNSFCPLLIQDFSCFLAKICNICLYNFKKAFLLLESVFMYSLNKIKFDETRSTGQQKISFFTPLTIINGFLTKFKVKNRSNRSTNNRDKPKVCDGVSEWHPSWRETELQKKVELMNKK